MNPVVSILLRTRIGKTSLLSLELGLADLSVEILHTLLIQIRQYCSNESYKDQYEQLLNLLRKG